MRRRALLVCLALAAAPVGCGGSGSSSDRKAAAPETADRAAVPPRGWSRVVDGASGFSVSLPPGWAARRSSAGGMLIRSRDRALAVAVSADRSRHGARDAPASYLRRTVHDLPAYVGLRAGRPVAVRDLRYPTARLTATGTLVRTRVRQAITLYALHRTDRVTYVLAAFRSAATTAGRYAPYLRLMVRSFRARPGRR